MNRSTLEVLKTRRSIRKFKAEPVPEEALRQIIEVGLYAPTGRGSQNPIILAVTDPEVRAEIARANAEVMGRSGIDPFYGAPAILIVLSKRDRLAKYDGSCVISNLMNAAWALGIGSCWIHRAEEEFDSPFGKELLSSLHIDGDYEGIGHVALGYIDGDFPEAKPRKENRVFYIR